MFNLNRERKERLMKLNAEIDRLEAKQAELDPTKEEYAKINNVLEAKYEERDKVKSFFSRIEPTPLVVGIGGLLVQGLVTVYFARREDQGPITSKAANSWFQSMFRGNRRV